MFVMGKRTRSCCQATGAAAPVPMAASTSAEAGLQQERPTRAAGGAHRPPEPGVPQLLWGDMVLCPLPCLRVPVPCPLHQRRLGALLQLCFQRCLAGCALAVQTQGRGCCLQGGAEEVSAEPLALPQHLSPGVGGSTHPFCSQVSAPARSPLSILWHSLVAGLAQPG